MQTINNAECATLKMRPLAIGNWRSYWAPYLPFTTTKGIFYFGFLTTGDSWYTQEFTQVNDKISGMGDVIAEGNWQNSYASQILLGGTDQPLFAGYQTDTASAFVERFTNDGNLGTTLSEKVLKNDAGDTCYGDELIPIINNVPNELVKNIALVSYKNEKIYIFEYNTNTETLDYKTETDSKSGYVSSCAYQTSDQGVILLQSGESLNGGYPVSVFTSDDTAGPYVYQKDITLPKLYDLMKPLISQGDMYLFCTVNDDYGVDLYYLDPAQGGIPVGPVSNATLPEDYTAGFIGYDSSNSPFTFMQSKDSLYWGLYTFLDGIAPPSPPPSTTRPFPPSVDGFLSDQCWGTAQLNTFISATLTQPDGTKAQFGPVSSKGNGDWSLDLNPQAIKGATLSVTATFGTNGSASDAFVRVLGQKFVTPVVLSSVGASSVSGSAAAGQRVLGWRSSDGAKLVDLPLSANQTNFNTPYYKNQTLPVDDQLNVVSADPDSGAMTPYTSAPRNPSTS